MDSLPDELVDSIITQLATASDEKDKEDAKNHLNVCLVSRRFHRVGQPHLYKAIRLDVRSRMPSLLLKTLKANPRLTKAVRELSIECAPIGSTPMDMMDIIQALRQFLQDLLPSLTNLTSLKSDHRVGTTKLVESVLYKEGNGYYMGIPTDLGNLRTLELFAADYIFKYNHILRLPQLERVVLNSTKVVQNPDNEDESLLDDWGWTSQSIKELVLHLWSGPTSSRRLKSNSFRALSRSMPRLESLRIHHYETNLYPCTLRCLAVFFAPQLYESMRRLELRDGRIDAGYPRPERVSNPIDDGRRFLPILQSAKLEYLFIDFYTFNEVLDDIGGSDTINKASIPPTVRHLAVRYVQFRGEITSDILSWDWQTIAHLVCLKFPVLKRLNLELRLPTKVDDNIISKYEEGFRAVGIVFTVRDCFRVEKKRSSIICSR